MTLLPAAARAPSGHLRVPPNTPPNTGPAGTVTALRAATFGPDLLLFFTGLAALAAAAVHFLEGLA